MSDDDLGITLGAASGPSGTPPGGLAGGLEVNVEIVGRVLDEMDGHVAEDTSVEHGGVMVGRVDAPTGTTHITGAIRAIGAESDIASLRFTHETWDHIGQVMERDFPGAQMVGWYHSHPHFGIFLSEHDQFIHRNFFSQPWQVAYVRDPLLDQRGFFAWQGDQIVQIPEEPRAPLAVDGATLVDPTVEGPPPLSRILVTEEPAETAQDTTRARRSGGKVLFVALAALALVAVAGAALVLGPLAGDDPEAELVLDSNIVGSNGGPAGSLVQFREIVAELGGDATRLEWEPEVQASVGSANGLAGGVLTVRAIEVPGSDRSAVALSVETLGAEQGTYRGQISFWACDTDDPCTQEEAVQTAAQVFDFRVDRPWEEPKVEDAPGEAGQCFVAGTDPLRYSSCRSGPQNRIIATFESEFELAEVPLGVPEREVFDALRREGGQKCVEAFEDVVGERYRNSAVELMVIIPSYQSWEERDERTVACALLDWEPSDETADADGEDEDDDDATTGTSPSGDRP